QRRSEWRGIRFRYTAAGPGEGFEPDEHDLIYIGGGQDRDQVLVAEDMLRTKGDAIASAVEDGAALLAVCGGYQLLGHRYQLGEQSIPGLGIADLETVRAPGPRLPSSVARARCRNWSPSKTSSRRPPMIPPCGRPRLVRIKAW